MIVEIYKKFIENLPEDYKEFYNKLVFILQEKDRQISLERKNNKLIFKVGLREESVDILPFFMEDVKKISEYYKQNIKLPFSIILNLKLDKKIYIMNDLNLEKVTLVYLNFRKQEIMCLDKKENKTMRVFNKNDHLFLFQIYKEKKFQEKINDLYEYFKNREKHIKYIFKLIEDLKKQVSLYKKL